MKRERFALHSLQSVQQPTSHGDEAVLLLLNVVDLDAQPPSPNTPPRSLNQRTNPPPMGMRQYSSSSMFLTLMPSHLRRASKRALSSGKSMAGRATSDVSSKKTCGR